MDDPFVAFCEMNIYMRQLSITFVQFLKSNSKDDQGIYHCNKKDLKHYYNKTYLIFKLTYKKKN